MDFFEEDQFNYMSRDMNSFWRSLQRDTLDFWIVLHFVIDNKHLWKDREKSQ